MNQHARNIVLLSLLLVFETFAMAQSNPVPSSFFAVSPWNASDLPTIKFGSYSHAQFAWASVEPCPSCFSDANFAQLDNYVSQAQQQGMWDKTTNTVNVAVTLGLTPSWELNTFDPSHCKAAPLGQYQCPNPPDHIEDWTAFVSALVGRYNGIGHPHIRYYELWNEANDKGWWAGSIGDLVKLAYYAYPIIHSDPYSQLLTPSVAGPVGGLTTTSADSWMASYLGTPSYVDGQGFTHTGAEFADGGAYHGYLAKNGAIGTYVFPMPEQDFTLAESPLGACTLYDICFGSVLTKANMMHNVFNTYLPGKPMLQTEGGWGQLGVTDPDAQVAWLARYNLLHASVHSSLNLQMVAWFAWDGPAGWGVIENNGIPTAAGKAYSEVYDWAVGAEIDNACAPISGAADGTWACNMTRAAGYNAIAIWNTQGAAQYTPGAPYQRYRCLDNANCMVPNTLPLVPGAPLTISTKPLLLEASGQDCLLYDPTRAAKSGSTIPIKLEICDNSGADLSSSSLPLHALSIVKSSSNTSTDLAVVDNASPDSDFRFDPTLGSSGGYIFNLSTKGLASGSYILQFQTVTGDQMVDSFVLSAPFQVK